MSDINAHDLQTERYLSVEGTARFLHIAKGSVYNWVWAGKLIPFRIGRKLLFKRTDLERLVETSNKGGTNGRF